MLKQILQSGWRIVPVGLPGIDYKGKITMWHVIGPNDKTYSAPLPKYKALIELRKAYKKWLLQK